MNDLMRQVAIGLLLAAIFVALFYFGMRHF